MKRLLMAAAAVAFGAVALVAAEQALAQRERQEPAGTYETTPVGQYAFFAASQPANATHVGIFVAVRLPQKAPQLYYCSSPSDAGAKENTACRAINAFPK